MNRDCSDGFRLRKQFETKLKQWGWFDAFEKAIELMHLGPAQVHEFQAQARKAQSELLNARLHTLTTSRTASGAVGGLLRLMQFRSGEVHLVINKLDTGLKLRAIRVWVGRDPLAKAINRRHSVRHLPR